jgi:hypothetical protein
VFLQEHFYGFEPLATGEDAAVSLEAGQLLGLVAAVEWRSRSDVVRTVPAGTLRSFSMLWNDGTLISNVKSVPAGTWNTFCTQIHLLAQLISLHLECEADYAAG